MSSSSHLHVNSISPTHASSSSTPSIPQLPSELTSLIVYFLDPKTAKTLALMPRLAPMVPSLTERAIISGHDVTNDEGITAHIDDINGMLSDDVRTLLNVDQTPLEKCSVGRRSTIIKDIEKMCKERFKHWSNPLRADLLKAAAKNGSDTIINALIDSDYCDAIAYQDLVDAYKLSAQNGFVKNLHALPSLPPISRYDYEVLMQFLGKHSHINAIPFFVDNQSYFYSERLLSHAIISNRVDIVKAIIHHPKLDEIMNFKNILELACGACDDHFARNSSRAYVPGDRLPIPPIILASPSWKAAEDHQYCCENATHNRIEIVKALLSHKNFSYYLPDHIFLSAVVTAAELGYTEIVHAVIHCDHFHTVISKNKNWLPDICIKKAANSTKNGAHNHADIVKVLEEYLISGDFQRSCRINLF